MIEQIKCLCTPLILTAIAAVTARATAVPVAPVPAAGVESGFTLRAFRDVAPFTAMVEAGGSNQTDARKFREWMLGGYYQIGDIVVNGAHDEDHAIF